MLEAFFENAPDLFAVISQDGRILRVNAAWTGVLGLSRAELEGRNWSEVITELVPQIDRKNLLSRAGATARLRHRAGGYRRLNWRFGFSPDGQENWAFGRDVTDSEAKRQTQQRLATLGELATGIAHEINNPLAIVHIRANQLRDLAAQGNVSVADAQKIAQTLEASSIRISKLVKAVRGVADGFDDEFEDTALAGVLEDTHELCRSRLKAAEVELRLAPISASVRGRPVQLRQLALGLILPCLEAAKKAPDAEKYISVSASEDRGWVAVHFECACTCNYPEMPDPALAEILEAHQAEYLCDRNRLSLRFTR